MTLLVIYSATHLESVAVPLPVRGIAILQPRKRHAHLDERDAGGAEQRAVGFVERRHGVGAAVRHAERLRGRPEIHVLRGEEQPLEIRVLRFLGQHVEDGAAVVVQQHDDDARNRAGRDVVGCRIGRMAGRYGAGSRWRTWLFLQMEYGLDE